MRAHVGVYGLALLAQSAAAVSVPEIFSKSSGKRLGRRQDDSNADNLTIPAPMSIAPSQYWDGNDGPWSSFPLQMGGGNVQVQNVRVMPSTASYNTWVIDPAGCPPYYIPDCANQRGFLYNSNDSLTYYPLSIFGTEIEQNLGMQTTGEAGYETITLGWQGSGGPTVEHTPIIAIADTQYFLGIFGLNPLPTNFTKLNNPQPSFLETLASNNSIPSRSYGYTAGNQYRLNEVYGSLTLGGYDSNRFEPTDVTFPFYSDISRDLLVNVKSITTDKGETKNLLPDGQISTYLDSTISTIWLPESACDAFETAFGISYNSTVNRYTVNSTLHSQLVDLNPSVTITLTNGAGDVAITLPYGAFDLNVTFPIVDNGTTSYYFPLQRAVNETQYTLGRTFFQEAYLIADYDAGNFTVAPCTWDQSAVQSTSIRSMLSPKFAELASSRSPNSSEDDSGISGGAIAGIVIGIIAAIALLLLALFFLHRKKRARKSQRAAELEAKNPSPTTSLTTPTNATHSSAHPDNPSTSETKPFISAPMGGELDSSNEIHELTAPNKPPPVEMESPHGSLAGKQGYSEMPGSAPIYEMEGSEVHEIGSSQLVNMREKR